MPNSYPPYSSSAGCGNRPKPERPLPNPLFSPWNNAWRRYLQSERGSKEAREALQLIRSVWR